MTLQPGAHFGHYAVNRRIGAGGMGEVYSARDEILGRQVALKLLTGDLTSDRDRLRRFEQEARATSALNHPNILTIYEIGKTDSLNYIASELVDGMTLRELLARGRPHLIETLDIAIQVTAALSAAHANGIVHRDIKPENVMVRKDGLVKVLDFGLAKLTAPQMESSALPDASTAANILTDPGAIIGTVAYMSPEQLRVQDIDSRTDIWSVGVVLYEMIAGHAPFDQPTKSDLIVAILEHEPALLTLYSADTPPEIQSIIMKTLRKRKEERYSSARELSEDLIRSRNALAKFENLTTLNLGHGPSTGPHSKAIDTNERTQTTGTVKGTPTISAELLINTIKSHSRGVLLSTMGVLAVLASVVFFVTRPKENTAAPIFRRIVTTTGVREAAVSPDGKFIAAVVRETNGHSIRVRQIATSSDISIVSGPEEQYRGVTFSHDGTYVYYLKKGPNGSDLFEVSSLGGTSQRLISDINTPVAISKEGKLAYVRKKKDAAPVLMIANADGSGETEVQTKLDGAVFSTSPDLNNGPAWSTDGQTIISPVSSIGEPYHMDIAAVRIADGSVKILNAKPWYLIGQLACMANGNELVMNAESETPPASTFQVWRMSLVTGEATRSTNDASYYRGISLTADSQTLVTTQSNLTSNIWTVKADDPNQYQQLPNSQNKATGGLSFMSDGRLVYASAEAGNQDVWTMDSNGVTKRLTFKEYTEAEPTVSGDGRYIFYVAYPKGTAHLWYMNTDGTDQKPFTSGYLEDSPDCSSDNKWVVYHSEENYKDSLYRIPVEDGPPTKITETTAIQPSISPDGKLVAYFSSDDNGNSPWQLKISPIDGDTPVRTFSIPSTVCPQCVGPRWTRDGQSITYVVTNSGVSNIWIQNLNEGPARALTNFNQEQIYSFAWSRDGRQLVCVRGSETRDVILVTNFK